MEIDRRNFIELAGVALAATTINAQVKKPSRALPKSEFDYVDWSWARWRQITKAPRPSITGDHTGKAELIDLLRVNDKKITSPDGWQTRREYTKNLLNKFVGTPPRSKPPLAASCRSPKHNAS